MTWAVVQTEAMREHAVRLLLERARYECYLPRIKAHGRISALFPGYIFVGLTAQWYPILRTVHVLRLLMAGDQPARLSDDIVGEIRRREKNGLVMLPELSRRYRKGQAVRIVRGSFEGRIGIYDGMSGKDRERVLLELLGQHVVAKVRTNDVQPLDVVAPSPQIK